ncbi:PASTA domain-containing protein [Oscillospiraceae bacterium MB08-C2-2]|nr:PASTA domain-containing protein [Oscillospiraceae bacterium MB08-C2-2]
MDIKKIQYPGQSTPLTQPMEASSTEQEQGQFKQQPVLLETDQLASFQDWLKEMEERQLQADTEWEALYQATKRELAASKSNWSALEIKPKPIPTTVGLSSRIASRLLSEHGFRVAVTAAEYSDSIPEGDVIITVPMPGSSAAEGSGIKLIVSKGPAPKGHEKAPQDLLALGELGGSKKKDGDDTHKIYTPFPKPAERTLSNTASEEASPAGEATISPQ